LRSDLGLMAGVATAALVLLVALWKEFELTSFDPVFAASLGLPVALLDAVMTAMIALAVVLGLQMVGVVLMSAMIVAPAVAARQWTNRLGLMVLLAAVFAALSGVVGALASASARGLATGPLIVLTLTVWTAISLTFAPNRGFVAAARRRRRVRHALRDRQVLALLDELAQRHDDPNYASEQGLLDELARVLFRMSSPLPDPFTRHAALEGLQLQPGARGMAFNADMVCLIQFLNMGTQAAPGLR